MGYLTKVQSIKRKKSEQWYVNVPSAVAQALDFVQSEEVQWTIHDKGHLILSRRVVPPDPVPVKKTAR
jgi:antitoxin component of MazEF toxin-antitoxin module